MFRQTERADALKVTVEGTGGGQARLLLEGELDLESASFMRGVFVTALPRAGAVVLDLDGVSFLDSSGLKAVLLCAMECEQRGLEFSVTEGSPQVRRLFEITRVTDQLRFSPPRTVRHDHPGTPVPVGIPAVQSHRIRQGSRAH